MKTTKREFYTSTQDGKEVKIVATYVSELTTNPLLSNYPTTTRDYVSTSGSEMVAYVDGQRIRKACYNPAFWRLIDVDGAKKIWGMPICFADADKIAAYNAFLADVMQDDDEVKQHKEQEAAEWAAELAKCRVQDYKSIIAWYKRGYVADSVEDAREKRNNYNNVANEGGYGYCPTWVTHEQYQAAVEYLAKHEGVESP